VIEIVDPVTPPVREGPRPLALWSPVIGPMVATLVMLEMVYALVGPACRRETRLFLHLVAAAALLASILLTLPAARIWRERGRGWDTQMGGSDARTRFMAVMGLLSGASGALIIIAQWAAIFFHDPCAIA
jgi:hypothetical protein